MTPDRKKSSPEKQEKQEEFYSEFEQLDLPEPVMRGIRAAGFAKMTPIQKRALEQTLNGSDMCGQAQTGTGKTAAFLITLFSRMIKFPRPEEGRLPRALILAPTRELALQIFREARMLGKFTGIKMVAVYGGEGYKHQENAIRDGVDIVVGTPGRTLDFAKRRVLNLGQVEYLVIDEADRLLDMGFWEELRSILRLLPPAKNRQSMLYSATLDFRTKKIAWSYMADPKDVVIRPESIAADGIVQQAYHVEIEMKFPLLLGILQREKPAKGLIFTNMKITASWLVKKLQQNGFEVTLLTGDLRQKVRNNVLKKFTDGEVPLMVASDVASRGLHIDDVTHIINFDVPMDAEDYIHRIGRTARAGKKGKAFTLACDKYCYYLPEIEKLLGTTIPSTVPYDEDFGEDATPEYTPERHRQHERRKQREGERGGNSRPRTSKSGPKRGSRPQGSKPRSGGDSAKGGSTPRSGPKRKPRRPSGGQKPSGD